MFDCKESPLDLRRDHVSRIKHISIIHVCCCCGNRLETFWDSKNELDGKWMAIETEFSEIFSSWVAYPNSILCNVCFGTGEWKRKGIKWKN